MSAPETVDKVGGFIAVVLFGLVFLLYVYQTARRRSVYLMPLLFFTITNRHGVKWSRRSTIISAIVTLICVILGVLEAIGLITWLNNPDDKPTTVLKVAEIGFLALAVLFALAIVFFSLYPSPVYQSPFKRFSTYPPAILLVIRCLFEMLLATDIIDIAGDKRPILRYFTMTLLEMIIVWYWAVIITMKIVEFKAVEVGTDTYIPSCMIPENGENTSEQNLAQPPPHKPVANTTNQVYPIQEATPHSDNVATHTGSQFGPPHHGQPGHHNSPVPHMIMPEVSFDVGHNNPNLHTREPPKYHPTPYPVAKDGYFASEPNNPTNPQQ
ncbi:hypothetical protein H4219_000754 [Mycoemilia scoparia]|uniref:Uncharacterized protein n=1 Tax=Mycoemilia scoparia TaxID=417184 RepID=A0A9W8A1T9_9FUNG|nr:hypothetical protein H4219_000754 [Mycoemilia scoparia]